MDDSLLARLVALKTTPLTQLRNTWRELFGDDPPPYNRTFMEKRLAYRLQELAYGGLKKETERRIEALGQHLDTEVANTKGRRTDCRPLAGTRLIREWQGKPHEVTVQLDHFEYLGQRFKSLSAIARAITGTSWNGPVFFGLRRGK